MIAEIDCEDKYLQPLTNFVQNLRAAQTYQVLGPLSLCIDHDTSHPGCIIIDLVLSKITNVKEIVFKNSYTAYISVLMRFHPSIIPKYDSKTFHLLKGSYPSPNIKGWQMVIPHYIIMPDPNQENGSQDFVSLTSNENCDWTNVIAVRLILRQPSPVWNDFKIENLKIFDEERDKRIVAYGQNGDEEIDSLQEDDSPTLKIVKDKTLYMMKRDFDVSWTRSEYEFYQFH